MRTMESTITRTGNRATDRRTGDRRGATPFFSRYQLGFAGRRQSARREHNRTPAYYDRYDHRLFIAAFGVVVLSALDAAFTLSLLAAGAVEMNALMAVLIEQDVRKFVSLKLALTSLAVLFLVIHHDFTVGSWIKVRHIQYGALAAYVTLIGYELALLRVAYG
jgi:hypothetical protein